MEALLHVDGDIYQLGEVVVATPQVSQESGIKPFQQMSSGEYWDKRMKAYTYSSTDMSPC